MFDLPLWAELGGLAVAVIVIGKAIGKAWYAGTIYQVKRMQDKGEIPEMTKLSELETKIDAIDDKIENGLRDDIRGLSAWQSHYGPKVDDLIVSVNQMVGALREHLRRNG